MTCHESAPNSPLLSVIIPAFNEEACLPATLTALNEAVRGHPAEVLVVDNESTDATRLLATEHGAQVVFETVHNIGRVRNTGARAASGAVFVFLDADTIVPSSLLVEIIKVMQEADCAGGAVAVEYAVPQRRGMRWYLKGWGFWGSVFNMKQGAAQFCRREAFLAIGGYDETIYVGEDVHFYWRLSHWARKNGRRVVFLDSPKVLTSSRRFDKLGMLRTLVLTHPIVIWLFWRWPALWKDWYQRPVR